MNTITFGKYPLPTSVKPSDERPIYKPWEWLVLGQDNGRQLVLSKDIVDWEMFGGFNTLFEEAKPCTWRESYLRQYLRIFYDISFTDKERTNILTNNDGDHLFILDAETIYKYLPNRESRIANIEWAEDDLDTEPYEWWTSSIGPEDSTIQTINDYGDFDFAYNDADEVGVRPAMFISNNQIESIKVGKFSDQRKVYIFPRPFGSDVEVIEHASACCKFVEKAGRIPVLDQELYPQVIRHMSESCDSLAYYYAVGTPLEECEDVLLFTQAVSGRITEVRRAAELKGIPVIDLVGVRL